MTAGSSQAAPEQHPLARRALARRIRWFFPRPFLTISPQGSDLGKGKSLSSDNDDIVFIAEDADAAENWPSTQRDPWRILIVDDDPDVHEATRFTLADTQILNRPLQLLHAYSGTEALALLREHQDIAVILLDVVMESDDAGLRTVDTIRNDLKLFNTRIVLRTGQPGQAPELETIARYDINDYKSKSELTRIKLFTTLTGAIRSFDQLQRLDANRKGLEKIVAASNHLIAEQGLRAFAEGVITQIASLIGTEPEGVVCAATDEPEHGVNAQQFRIIAAAGNFRHLIQRRLSDIDDARIVQQLSLALEKKQNIIQPHCITLYFQKTPEHGFAAFIDSALPIREVDQELLRVFCTNIALCAKNVDLVEELRQDAFIDRQLRLPNRTALVCELSERLAREASPEQMLAVVDIDQFSTTHDILGNDYVESLLRLTARRLRDAFPPTVFIARLAGDAFALLGAHDLVTAEALQQCFVAPFSIEKIDHVVSVCTGLVRLGGTPRSAIEYVKDGFLALKKAKSRGIGQSVVYSEEMGRRARERSHLLRDLRLAFGQEQLFLTYQPQIDLASGRVIGVEALLRWRRKDGELIPPDRFIPVAEQSGLIVGLGGWIVQTALLALQRFQAQGLPMLRMAVNVSPVQLRQPNFLGLIDEAIRQTGSDPAQLEIEITESVAVGGIDPIIKLLEEIRARGVSVALDDFGTGYSSLSYLQKLPADRLKIDRSFVSALEKNDQGTRIARTIILLGHELELEVIAEGVESQSTADVLVALGCETAQGYHYARPMSEDEFVEWLARYIRLEG